LKKNVIIPVFTYIILLVVFITGWWLFQQRNILEFKTISSTISKQLAFRISDNIRYHIDELYRLKQEWENKPFDNYDDFTVTIERILLSKGGFQAINFVDTSGTIIWVVPEATNRGAIGKNLYNHQDPSVIATYTKTVDEGKLEFTPPIPLFQGGWGYASYLPVILDDKVVGYINGVFRIDDIIEYCLSNQDLKQFVYYIDDNNKEIYQSFQPLPNITLEILGSYSIPVFDRFWTVYVSPSSDAKDFPSLSSKIILILGVIIIFCISWMLRIMMLRQIQVKNSESEYKFLVQNLDVGVFISRDNIIIYSNSITSNITGFEKVDILGKSPYDFIKKEYHESISEQENNAIFDINPPKLIEVELECGDKSVKWARINMLPIQWENLSTTIFLFADISEYKLAYLGLRRSEERYRFLFENIQDAVIVHDGNTIVFVNDAGVKMVGAPEMGSLVGTNISRFIHPDYKDVVNDRILQMKDTGKPLPLFQEEMINLKGEKLTVEVSSGPIIFDDKMAFQVIIRNITSRLKMAQDLKDSEVYYRNLFNSNADAVFIFKKSKVIECNRRALELYKCQLDDIIGSSPFLFSNKLQPNGLQSDQSSESFIKSAYQTGEARFEWLHTCKDRSLFDSDVTLKKIKISEETYLLGVIRDITELKNKEKKEETLLQISQSVVTSISYDNLFELIHKHLSTLLDTTNFYIAIIDEKESLIQFPYFIDEKDAKPKSRSFAKGLTEYIFKTGKPKILYYENIKSLEKSGEIVLKGTPPQIWLGAPLKLNNKIMGIIVLQSYHNPYEYDETDLEFVSFVAEQIAISINWKTQEINMKKSELRFKKLSEHLAESNAMKELLLDVVSHDLKNPAGVLSGISEIMISEDPDNEYARIIHESSESLLNVIDNTASLSKMVIGEQLDIISIDLVELLKNVVNDFESPLKEAGMTIELKIHDKLIINNNPIISEVFKNFISNAIKFASSGKKIIVETKRDEKYLTVNIIDFGKTIPKKDYVKVFRRGIQLGKGIKQGRGLGLSIVRRISEAHNGKTGVKPNTPNGNIFYLKLPLEK
jgi:PAS domain S-box-containing protein